MQKTAFQGANKMVFISTNLETRGGAGMLLNMQNILVILMTSQICHEGLSLVLLT